MGNIDDIANNYVNEWAPLDPLAASYAGIAGYDHLLTDVSSAGFAAVADLDRRTLTALDAATPATERERVAKEAMQERLGLAVERYDAQALLSGALGDQLFEPGADAGDRAGRGDGQLVPAGLRRRADRRAQDEAGVGGRRRAGPA